MRVAASVPFSACVVIPCFNHGKMLPDVIERLTPFGLHCFVIDDGSEEPTRTALEKFSRDRAGITLLRLPSNQGKGQAVLVGLEAAAGAGFTHAVQVDADGQHRIEDIPILLEQASAHPNALISGKPEYDESVPRLRLYGRYLTHVWVWIETLSFSLKDSMCGFRVYPINLVLQLKNQCSSLGKRMDFDIEIMVRLYWAETDSLFVPTRVVYPADGISHFDVWRDNWRIAWMHMHLFFGMLKRMPSLLARPLRKPPSHEHWSDMEERKGLWGMRAMFAAYRLFGRGVFNVLLYPVVGCFWLSGRVQRQSSREYLERVRNTAAAQNRSLGQLLSSFRHMLRFGDAILDKLACWSGDIQMGRHIDFAPESFLGSEGSREQGGLILVSHLGDIETCRALVKSGNFGTVNTLVYNQHAPRFSRMMEEISPDFSLNLIQVTDIGPDTAMLLREKLEAKEWVAIAGDRTAVSLHQRGSEHRVVWSRFLGKPAPFPQGPFMLAAALRCRVVLLFALKQQGMLKIYSELFADPLVFPRASRQQALQQAVDCYATRLEHHCLLAPLDWFNFFDFWRLPGQEKIQ